MTRHIVIPARRSATPGAWVSWCIKPECRMPFHGSTAEEAYDAAKAHCAAENQAVDDGATPSGHPSVRAS